jgi:hypothetical protein
MESWGNERKERMSGIVKEGNMGRFRKEKGIGE